MRSLAYFIGTFAVALLLGIGSAWYMIEQGSPLTTTRVSPWAAGMPWAIRPQSLHQGASRPKRQLRSARPSPGISSRALTAPATGSPRAVVSRHRLADQCAVVVDHAMTTPGA